MYKILEHTHHAHHEPNPITIMDHRPTELIILPDPLVVLLYMFAAICLCCCLSMPASAMELFRFPLVLLVLLLYLLAGSSTTALPALPGMDRVRQQVDRANWHGPSIGLVMSYVDEDTALQASDYFRPWHIRPFVEFYDESPSPISDPDCLL